MNQCKKKETGLHQRFPIQGVVSLMARRATALREQWRKVDKTRYADRSIPRELRIMLREIARRAEANATAMIDSGLDAMAALHRKDYSACVKAMDDFGQGVVDNAILDVLATQIVTEVREYAHGR